MLPPTHALRSASTSPKMASTFFFLFLFSVKFLGTAEANPNYREALSKSLLFFEGQRSGRLPLDQRIIWRSNSGLSDGSSAHVDLTGGYYDAGDNVKFNFPMAFSTTMLSWGALEYGKRMGPELQNARVAIRWATDYLLKCARATPGKLYVGVGNPTADHRCWERPEDMDTPRSVYSVSPSNPGSDVAAETAAALAAASMVFRKADPKYSRLLLSTAKMVMQFAIQYKGSYSDSLASAVCPFYCSYSGYKDELMWGAAWLLRATNNPYYANFIKSLGGRDQPDIFSWDNKYAGAYVLLSRRALLNRDITFEPYKQAAENFICKILPHSPYSTTQYTQGGLMYKLPQSNLQYVTSITFLVTTYAKYMKSARRTFNCGNLVIVANSLISLSKRQVDYILGMNPLKMSYMVGFGPNFPRRIHHRGSSLPSLAARSKTLGCNGGFQSFYTQNPNPNILTGAIVGGPNENDGYPDQRDDYSHSEPATYINAAFVGPLSYFAASASSP
ncbi:PREDICTED: endoglucanase 9 [Tarenaya hassleriana]|uniref:endoglucanase 9 n=1 Tax=Tarenaya hassleriana TaxID=28532 RepID=UPI00053C867D|nr:PREDICTED: endoglucanase 9 [Tarenaya hassleriana]